MSDRELTQLCKELSSQIVLAHLLPLPQRETTNKHVNIELAKLSHIKITDKCDKFLHTMCSQISTTSATLYRLCHRKSEMSMTSISTSGTFTDDVAVCVLSTIMQEQPILWSALCYRAILMKPKRPILRLGIALLTVITIKEIKQFTNRAKQVLNLELPRSCKRQRQHSQEHEQKEEEENQLSEKENTPKNVQTCSEKQQVAVISKLKIVNNKNIYEQLSSSESSSSTTLLDDEQAEFVSVHYFVRITSIQEQIRTPALISVRAHDKRQHCNLTKVSDNTTNQTSILNTRESSNVDNTHKKSNHNINQNVTDSLTNIKNSWSNDNFYLESNKEELVPKENDNDNNGDDDDDTNALRTTFNLPSHVVSSLLTTSLWSESTSNWLQLIADIKRCKQINEFAKLSHLISNPLLLTSHECYNRKAETEENNQTHSSNLSIFNEATLSRKPNINEKSCESMPSLQEMSLSPAQKLASKACYVTNKFVWTRLLICALWLLMLESMQTDNSNFTSEFCENVAKLSARFILQARKWSAETHCPVCDELQLERAPIHWSLIQEDRKELNRQLGPFMNELQNAQASVDCSHTTAPFHVQEEEELCKEKESKPEESLTQKESISTQNLTKEHSCTNVYNANSNDTRFTSNDCNSISAKLINSHHTHLLWSNLCKCTTFKQFCNVLRKGSNTKASSSFTFTPPYSIKSVQYKEQEELCVTETDVTTTAAGNDNNNRRIGKNEVECDEEITKNMREMFVVALTHRLQTLVQLLEAVTHVHHSMQVNSFMHHGEVHTSKKEQHSVNNSTYVNIKGKRVHLDDDNNLLLRDYGWVIGDNAEFTLGQWISSSLPSLYTLATREWLSNINISWCANMLCKIWETNSECEHINSTKHNMSNMDVNSICNNNNNKKACCKEQLHFVPIVPLLLCKDKIVECARCFVWFHHRCIAPPQDCFIDGKFMCHGCRLLVCKELQNQIKSQKEKLHYSHEKVPQDFVQCSAYYGYVPEK